jgi:hypothetical protein
MLPMNSWAIRASHEHAMGSFSHEHAIAIGKRDDSVDP